MNAGSAVVVAPFRCVARGRAIASGSDEPRSSRSKRTWSTVPGIVEPPGEPTARNGLPARVTIVGLIELRGRLLASARFRWVVDWRGWLMVALAAARLLGSA